MSASTFPVPDVISHLDFDPDEITVVEEKKEPEKTCQLLLAHPHNKSDRSVCGRLAMYKVKVKVPVCGHTVIGYVCASCWSGVEQIPSRKWRCKIPCEQPFVVKDHLISWEKIR